VNGTWKTTGTGGSALVPVAVIAAVLLAGSGALTTLAAALTSLAEIVLACVAAVVAAAAAAVVVVWRRHGRQLPPLPEQVAAYRSEQRLRAGPQRPQIAAPAQHVHFHFHGTAQPEGVPVLRAIKDGEQR
jgi:protein-S-isoprenylcysteine O-methyltransferase Ste14